MALAGTHIAVTTWHGELPEPSPDLTDPTAPSPHQHGASCSQTTEPGRGTDPAPNPFAVFFLSFFHFSPRFLSLGSVLSWSRSPMHFTLQLHKCWPKAAPLLGARGHRAAELLCFNRGGLKIKKSKRKSRANTADNPCPPSHKHKAFCGLLQLVGSASAIFCIG